MVELSSLLGWLTKLLLPQAVSKKGRHAIKIVKLFPLARVGFWTFLI